MTRSTTDSCALATILALICAFTAFALIGCTAPSTASPDASAVESQEPDTLMTAESAEASATSSVGNSNTNASSISASSTAGNSSLAKQLKSDLKSIAKKSGMDVGICVIDPKTDTHVSIGGDKRMVSASMIKLAVAASILEQVEAGKFALDDTYTLKEDDIVGGTGSLGGRGAGAEVTYGEMLELMIAQSDNTATNALISAVSMKAVNDTAKNLNLKSTELNRLMMDEDAIAKGVENYTSANDIATILELASHGKLVSRKASKTLVAALEKQIDDTGILAGLPASAKFAHKTGALSNAQNDGGIVSTTGNSGDFVIAVMCGGDGFNLDGALETMADAGRISYRDIVEQP